MSQVSLSTKTDELGKINDMNEQTNLNDLPRWAWLWFPPVMLIAIYCFRAMGLEIYNAIFETEQGLIELSTPLLAFIGVGFGIAALRYHHVVTDKLAVIWIACTTLGCFYIGGEEISWGQWLFFWETPETFLAINDQQETNIHNISSWFDQKPRMFLEIWVLIGGIIFPIREMMGKRLHASLDTWRYWFWPTPVMLPTGILVIVSKLPERYLDIFDVKEIALRIRYSEAQEYYFALFLLLYLASIWLRLKQLDSQKV